MRRVPMRGILDRVMWASSVMIPATRVQAAPRRTDEVSVTNPRI
jgi:hypothetical protein